MGLFHKIMQILLGFLLAFSLSWTAWKFHALTKQGMWAATVVGGLIFVAGHIPWSLLILAFFISSNLLSLIPTDPRSVSPSRGDKTNLRDWSQVLANGGWGLILATITLLNPQWSWPFMAYAGGVAAITSDTWATEIGRHSRQKPQLITTGQIVEPGASGGVTLLGTLASLAGSVFIAAIVGFVSPNSYLWEDLLFLVLAGFIGSLFDSFLGASVQAIYRCPKCGTETEQHPLHFCQTPTVHHRGWTWLSNDGVNFLSSLVGSGATLALWLLFP